MRKFFKIELPTGYYNVGVSVCNRLVADTNDTKKWDTLSIPLPKLIFKKWVIYKNEGKQVWLVKKFKWCR